MSLIVDAVLDAGLAYVIAHGSRIDVCSSAPTTYGGIASVTLGHKTGLTVGSQGDRTGGGRKVTVPAITDGTVDGTGTTNYWVLSDGSSILVAVGPLNAGVAVVSGDTFTLAAFDIGIPDAA
jgi:hypothetical protein